MIGRRERQRAAETAVWSRRRTRGCWDAGGGRREQVYGLVRQNEPPVARSAAQVAFPAPPVERRGLLGRPWWGQPAGEAAAGHHDPGSGCRSAPKSSSRKQRTIW